MSIISRTKQKAAEALGVAPSPQQTRERLQNAAAAVVAAEEHIRECERAVDDLYAAEAPKVEIDAATAVLIAARQAKDGAVRAHRAAQRVHEQTLARVQQSERDAGLVEGRIAYRRRLDAAQRMDLAARELAAAEKELRETGSTLAQLMARGGLPKIWLAQNVMRSALIGAGVEPAPYGNLGKGAAWAVQNEHDQLFPKRAEEVANG